MSSSDVFGSPMTLTGKRPVSPFGAAHTMHMRAALPARIGRRLLQALQGFLAPTCRERRIRKTVTELSRLDDHMLRDIGLNRAAITSAAREADEQRRRGRRQFTM